MNQLLLVSFVLRLFLYKRFEVKSPGQKLLLTQPVSQAAGPVQPGQNYGSVTGHSKLLSGLTGSYKIFGCIYFN